MPNCTSTCLKITIIPPTVPSNSNVVKDSTKPYKLLNWILNNNTVN